MTAGIYQVLNKVTGDRYVDGSCYIEQMIESIIKTLSLPNRIYHCHPIFQPETKLSQDWLKYGRDNFTLSIIEKTSNNGSSITPRKVYWCRLLQPRYNLYHYDPIVSGVYQIISTQDNCSYIGQSTDIFHRWKQHKYQLRHDRHHNQKMQASYNLHGESSFELRILEVYQPDLKPLVELEKSWIKRTDNLFNIVV